MPGSIVFRPLEANLTHNTEWIGKMDPYVSFLVGTHKVRTNVCRKGGKNPMWEDNITVPVSSSYGTVLVEVKDKDIIIDDRIGSCEVDLREIEAAGTIKKWYPLFHKEKPAGELLMEAVFTGDAGFATHLGQPTTSFLPGAVGYGAPLQSGFVSTGAPLQSGFVSTGVPLQNQGLVPGAGYKSISEQLAEESLLRGIDPLHTHHAQPLGVAPTGMFGGGSYVGQPGLIGNQGYGAPMNASNVPFNVSVNPSELKRSELPMQHGHFVPVGTGLGSDYLTNTVTVVENAHHGITTPHGQPLTFSHDNVTTLVKEGLNPTTQGPIGTNNIETYDRNVKHI